MSFVKSHFAKMTEAQGYGANLASNYNPASLSAGQFGIGINQMPMFNGSAYGIPWYFSGTNSGNVQGGYTPVSNLKLLSGTIGTTAAIDALTDFPTAGFAGQTLVVGQSTSTSYASPNLTMNFSGTNAATASGTATWFILQFAHNWGNNGAPQGAGWPAIWGTVGLAGSGADLIVSETNIVSGLNYQLPKIVLPIFQQAFTF